MKKVMLLLFILLSRVLPGQQARFEKLDMNQGLSQNAIFSLELDSKGNVWAGTLNGLNKFNGSEIKTFMPHAGEEGHIKGNSITCLTATENGNIWIISSNGGLNFYNSEKEHFIYYPDSVLNNFPTRSSNALCAASDDNLWLLHPNSIAFLHAESNKTISLKLENTFRGFCRYTENSVLLYGLSGIWKVGLERNKLTIRQLLAEEVFSVSQSQNGYLALMDEGVFSLFPENQVTQAVLNFRETHYKPTLGQNTPMLSYENEIWIGDESGLYKYSLYEDSLSEAHYSYEADNPFSFKGYSVREIKADSHGNLWISTYKHGLNFYNRGKNRFKHINWKHEALADLEIDPVRAILKTQDNYFYLGFDRLGMGIIHPNGTQEAFMHYYDADGRQHPISTSRCIFQDSQHRVWIGLGNNVCYFDRKAWQVKSIDCLFDIVWPYRTYSISQFTKEELLLTAPSRIGKLNLRSGQVQEFNYSRLGIPQGTLIRDLVQENENSYWIALDQGGLIRCDSTFRQILSITSLSHDLSDDKIYALSIAFDKLWIATNRGLNCYSISENKVIAIYNQENGLSNDIIYSVHAGADSTLWLSTDKGINSIKLDKNQVNSYLEGDYFMDDAWFYSANGEIMYGGHSGVILFNPKNIQATSNTFSTQLETFILNGRSICPGERINNKVILPASLNELSELKLSYTQNTFEIGFNTYPVVHPTNYKFRYQLKGWDNEWVYPADHSQKARFTKVSHGIYTFEVQVSAGTSQWSASKQLLIKITPPFWKTRLFQILFLLSLLLLVYFIFRIRNLQIKRRNIWLEKKVNDQTSDLLQKNQEIQEISEKLHQADQSKLRLFTNISHEFRTPLTLILGYLEKANDFNTGKSKAIIKNNALRLLRLVNQLIEFRKVDQEQLKLQVSQFDLIPFISEILKSFELLADQKALLLQFVHDKDQEKVWLDPDKLDKILYNLISNAIKYSPPNKAISLRIHSNEQEVIIQVIDQGIGISTADQEHIFDRFYRTAEGQRVNEGHGIGLAITKGLTEIQQGRIKLHSDQNKGSCFELSFKKGNNHFRKEDIQQSRANPLPHENSWEKEDNKLITLSNTRLLVVEDDDELADYIVDLFKAENYVHRVRNGAEALDYLEDTIPNLIISDIMMPLLDGIELCRRIKANSTTASIPIILLTAKTGSEIRIEGFQHGIDGFLEKPFNPEELITRVTAVLANRKILKEQIANTIKEDQGDKSKLTNEEIALWKNINKIIKQNYASPEFNAERLGVLVNMSRTTFYRHFKRLSHKNAADYIREYRLARGAELILNKKYTISQISRDTGFKSIPQFRKQFKELYGMTPTEWQKKEG